MAVIALLAFASTSAAQDGAMMPGMDPNEVGSTAPPLTTYGDGNFFSQELGTLLRIRYNTESYGQHSNGNLDIGTMQVASLQDAVAFFDGQVTLSDEQGVGFNLGLGYRWMNDAPFAFESQRIQGWSVWADGSSTKADNFFPQVGVSFESLGELWDLRANGYIPVGQQSQVGDFRVTPVTDFQGNFISALTEAVVDTSFFAGELEVARRLGAERDAWTFAGPYFLANDDDEAVGYRIGLRGYAYPDLLLQIAVSHDDIFETNAAFSLVWFVGRTRTDFQPACGLPDRFREPVLRNDYVVLAQSTATGGIPLTDANGDPHRFVHVDSNAAPGGDGTFENPLNNLNDIFGNSQTGDIVLAHAQSVFNGQAAVLQNDQRFLGEGNNMTFTIATEELGTFTIPETSPGARALTRPQINAAPGDAITMADNNEIANFDIDGMGVTARGIASPVAGGGNPNIHDVVIKNTTGDGIAFTPQTLTDTDDLDNDGNTTEQFVRGNVTINNVTFDNIGGDDMDINSLNADVGDPGVTLQETIAISNITSNNGNGAGLRLANTHDTGTASITTYTNGDAATAGSGGGLAGEGVLRFEDISGDLTITTATIEAGTGYAIDFTNVETTSTVSVDGLAYDGLAGAAGGLRAQFFNGTLNAQNSTLTNGTLSGVALLEESDGSFTFADTFTIDGVDAGPGEASFRIVGGAANDFTGEVDMNGTIENDAGRAIEIARMSDATTQVSFLGDITTSAGGSGISVHDNDDGAILFGSDVRLTTTNLDAVTLTNNNDANIDFAQLLDITTTSGPGFTATGGGTLTADGTTNKISTDGGQIVIITGMTIGDPAGVNFSEIRRTVADATNAVQLETNTGGPIVLGTVGDLAGDSGVIEGGNADVILIRNSENVTVSGIRINQANPVSGVFVDKTTNPEMTVNLNNLEINGGDIGIKVDGHGTSNDLQLTINDTDIFDSTVLGLSFNDVDFATPPIQINNVTLDGNNVNATAGGLRIVGSNAQFQIDSDTIIQEFGGTDFEVDGGAGTISMAGDIANSSVTNAGDTSGRSVNIHDITGGTVTFSATNSIVDTNLGILAEDNSGGLISFLGTHDLDTTINTAVRFDDNAGATLSIGQLDIVTTTGNGFEATDGGTLSVTGFGNKIVSAGGLGLDIEDMTIGAVDFESVTTTGGTNGIRLVNNTTGIITVGDTGNAAAQGGTIAGATDAGVHVTNSNVILNGVTVQNAGNAANDNAVEIFHTNATTMNVGLNRLTANAVAATRDGVVVDGTGGTGTFNVSIQNLIVDVTGDGLIVMNGVTLGAGGSNTIDVDTGVGLQLSNITVGTANANFDHVNVTAGTGNGIVLQDVLMPGGGQVQIGTVGGAANSGGALTTTGDAIVLENVQNADLRHVQIVNSTGGNGLNIDHTSAGTFAMDITIDDLNLDNASTQGINLLADNDSFNFALRLTNSNIANADVLMDVTGAGQFGLLVQNTIVNQDAAGRAFDLQFHDGATDGDVTIRGGSSFTANDGEGLFIDAFDGTNKDIKFLIEDSSFTDTTGTELAADIRSTNGNTLFQATIQGNTFLSAGAAHDMAVRSTVLISSRMQLLLGGDVTGDANNNSAIGQGTLFVEQTGAALFGIFQRDPTILTDVRNNDPVDSSGTFQDLGTAPLLPIVP
ncbi:MAG: hypothetical protein WD669_01335 [Pirellulales bacterium]